MSVACRNVWIGAVIGSATRNLVRAVTATTVFGMPNPAARLAYQRAPHASSPRRAAWEGAVLLLTTLVCALAALEVFTR